MFQGIDPAITALAKSIRSMWFSQGIHIRPEEIRQKLRQAKFVNDGYLRWMKCHEKQQQQREEGPENLGLFCSRLRSLSKHDRIPFTDLAASREYLTTVDLHKPRYPSKRSFSHCCGLLVL